MLKKTSLVNRIGSALIEAKDEGAQLEKVIDDMDNFIDTHSASHITADKNKYDSLDSINKQILSICNTPATDSRIKQFFRSRDEDNKTIDLDDRIQILMKEDFLGRSSNKYVVNPDYREFITVMPMSANITAEEDEEDEEYESPEELMDVSDEGYSVRKPTERERKVDDDVAIEKDVLFSVEEENPEAQKLIEELIEDKELGAEVIAEEVASQFGLDEGDVLAEVMRLLKRASTKKSFVLKKKSKISFKLKKAYSGEFDKYVEYKLHLRPADRASLIPIYEEGELSPEQVDQALSLKVYLNYLYQEHILSPKQVDQAISIGHFLDELYGTQNLSEEQVDKAIVDSQDLKSLYTYQTLTPLQIDMAIQKETALDELENNQNLTDSQTDALYDAKIEIMKDSSRVADDEAGDIDPADHKYDFETLRTMETLRSSHSMDLKIDTGEIRVWIMRTGEGEDGYGGTEAGYLVEKRYDEHPEWREVHFEPVIDTNVAASKDNITIGNIELKLVKDRDTDEWVVKYYEGGKYKEDPTYYTDDKQDAVETMDAMAERLREQQESKEATDIGLGNGITDRTEREEQRESLIGPKVSADAGVVNDLHLYIQTTGELYPERLDIFKVLTNQKKDDTYSSEEAAKLLIPYVEKGIESYRKELPDSDTPDEADDGVIMGVAKEFVEEFENEYENKGYDFMEDNSRAARTAARKAINKEAVSFLSTFGGTNKLTKNNLSYQAITFARSFLANYRFPLAPDIKFNAIKHASTDESNNVNGEVILSIEFRTISGIKKRADINVPIRDGAFLEPSTFNIDGQSYVISQSAIDTMAKSGTFYEKPSRGVFSNPLDRRIEETFNEQRLPKINKGTFSV